MAAVMAADRQQLLLKLMAAPEEPAVAVLASEAWCRCVYDVTPLCVSCGLTLHHSLEQHTTRGKAFGVWPKVCAPLKPFQLRVRCVVVWFGGFELCGRGMLCTAGWFIVPAWVSAVVPAEHQPWNMTRSELYMDGIYMLCALAASLLPTSVNAVLCPPAPFKPMMCASFLIPHPLLSAQGVWGARLGSMDSAAAVSCASAAAADPGTQSAQQQPRRCSTAVLLCQLPGAHGCSAGSGGRSGATRRAASAGAGACCGTCSSVPGR